MRPQAVLEEAFVSTAKSLIGTDGCRRDGARPL
jgi:hypothetical protein